MKLQPDADETDTYLDSGCGVSLADRTWLQSNLPDLKVLKMASSLKVRGVGANKYETDKFVVMSVYFPCKAQDGNKVLAYIRREFHLVDDLRTQILIGNDVIGPEKIVIDVGNKTATFGNCDNAVATVNPRQRGQYIRRKVHA